MKQKLLLFLTGLLFIAFTNAPDDDRRLPKELDDDNSKFTNVGNIGLTITNFGMYGHGFSLWPQQPSCEYPIGSGIEHLFDGGIWVGGFISDNAAGANRVGPFVTTGAVDAASVAARGGGFEFTNKLGSFVIERSNKLDSKFYSPNAISHQDLTSEYSDTNTTLPNGEIIQDHRPLGISIRQETYAWDLNFANNFIIMNYWVKNVTNKFIDSVYIGLWTDAVVRNTTISSPRLGTTFFNKGGNGYSDSLNIAYEFDAAGDIGFSDSYLGVQFLGSTPKLDSLTTLSGGKKITTVNFNSWQFRNTTDPNYFAPQNDFDRYKKMQGFFGGDNRFNDGINPAALKSPSNRSIMITSGPYHSIPPGDSINIVFAIIAAKKFGVESAEFDTEEQKLNLYNSAEWALRAYYGEDRNRNGILDPGEDLDGNGKITRYILPGPPDAPRVKVIPENNKATIYWDKRAESSIDPISGEMDFEGYRLYRTNAGFDFSQRLDIEASLIFMAQFDSVGNEYGYNTGYGAIELSSPVTFPGDSIKYWYMFEVDNLLNGWQYLFSVTSFDKGEPELGLESLESSILGNVKKVLPGSLPTSDENIPVGVYPNPYYGNAYWDGPSERLRKIYFYNLPSECEITVYTLAGDVVKRLYHNSLSNGSDLRWFETYSRDATQQMSGGEHAWDLVSDNDQAIATGLYLFTVKDLNSSNIKTGKFLIVK